MGGQPPSRVRIPPSPLRRRPANRRFLGSAARDVSPLSRRRGGAGGSDLEAHRRAAGVDVLPGGPPVGRLCLPSYLAQQRSRSRLSRAGGPTPSEASGLTAGEGAAT